MEASKLFEAMAGITREQASIVTGGKSDAAKAIRDLNRTGKCQHQGVFYSLARHDGNYYLASIDGVGYHGSNGPKAKHELMTWLVSRIDMGFLPLCKRCCEYKADEGSDECFGCEDRRTEAALDAWDARCESDHEDEGDES